MECTIAPLFNIQEKYNLEQMEFIKRRTKVFIIDISLWIGVKYIGSKNSPFTTISTTNR